MMGFSLHNMELKIKKGEFIALIGEFGSGKSSIIHAIMGEMNN
jgi:ABC-type dipeptide/oligopeptide/nickel transport system ATPase component